MKKLIYIIVIVLAFVKVTSAQTELNSTGTGAAYALSYPAAFTYSSGITITFKAHTVNTGAATLNVNGLGTRDIFKNVTTPLAFGDIAAGKFVTVIYDGTNFQLTTPVSSSSTPSWALAGNAGTTSATNFIGTTDAVDLVFRTDNIEKLRIKSTGNIGIGTTNPLYKLHLYSTANNGSDIVSETDGGRIIKHWFQNGGRSWSIGQTGTTSIPQYNFVITDETAGTSRLAINTNGDVGVGTTDPATNLHIRGVGVATELLQNADQIIDKDKPIAQLSFSDALTTDAQAAITVIRDEASSNASDVPTAITFSTVKDGNNASSIVERMRINSGGWVGIGTTIPQDMLSVGTLSQFMVGDNGEIKRIKGLNYTWPNAHVAGVLQNDGTGALSFGALPSGANAWTKSGSVIYNTTLTDNVGIGTTTPGTSKLNVTTSSAEALPTSITIDNNYNGAAAKYGLSLNLTSGGSGQYVGVQALVSSNNNNTINGFYANTTQSGTGTAYGLNSIVSASGTGVRVGLNNSVSGSGTNTSTIYGINNTVSTGYNSGFSQIYGMQNSVTAPAGNTGNSYGIYTSTNHQGSGQAVGYYSDFFSNGTGNRIGVQSSINTSASSTGNLTGFSNSIANSATAGSGTVKGIVNTLSNTAGSTGSISGIENSISVGNNATSFGFYNAFTSSGGNGFRYAIYNAVGNATGATGNLFGVYNQFFQNGSSTTFGVYNDLSNTTATSGMKYGEYTDERANASNTSNQFGNFITMSGANATAIKYGVFVTGENADYFSGNVGIGLNTPNNKLSIMGSSSAPTIPNVNTTALFRIGTSVNEGIDFGKLGSGSFAAWMQAGFGGATSDAFAINPLGGNVAISTDNPLVKLDVRGNQPKSATTVLENIFQVASRDATGPLALRMGIKTDATLANRYGAIEVDDAGVKRNLALQPTGGNVGIGTTTPGNSKLNITIPSSDVTNNAALIINNNYTGTAVKYGIDVNVDGGGTSNAYGISSSVAGLAGNSSNIYGYQVAMTPSGTGSSFGIYSSQSAVGTGLRYGLYSFVAAAATNTNTVYGIYNAINNAGSGTSWGIYNTGEDRNYFTGRLEVGSTLYSEKFVTSDNNTTGTAIARFINTNSATNNHGVIIRAGSSTAAGSDIMSYFRADGTSIGKVYQNTATSVQYLTTSDRNLKNLHGETKYGLADLMKIKIYDYSYKDDVNKKKMTGFVAQELFEAFPQSVAAPNGKKDDNGNEVPWMVDYGSVTPLLVKSIQDQQKLIEDLQKQIDLLKQQINAQGNK